MVWLLAIRGSLERLIGFPIFYFYISIKVSTPILIIAYIVVLVMHEGSTLADFAKERLVSSSAYFCALLLCDCVYKDKCVCEISASWHNSRSYYHCATNRIIVPIRYNLVTNSHSTIPY